MDHVHCMGYKTSNEEVMSLDDIMGPFQCELTLVVYIYLFVYK